MNKRNRFLIVASLTSALLLSACENTDNNQAENGQGSVTLSDTSSKAEITQMNEENNSESSSETTDPENEVKELKISIGGTEYTAHFYDTKAAEEFKAMLPLTLNMSELNGNEKYIYMDSDFTAKSEKVGSIKKGELMLYGSSCVVLFYDSFRTSYSYTRLGYIDDPSGIENAVGSGSVTVEFYSE